MRTFLAVAISLCVGFAAGAQPAIDPHALLKDADRLAWLRAWSQAEAQFTQAQQLFAAAGDERNALYAEVSALRGRLPRLPVPEVSAKLAEYLEHPLVQADDRLRLRVLVIKGETDEDLDPTLAGAAWKEALAVAERLGDDAWANRARGELGLVAFLEGNAGGAVMALGSALKTAQANGDVSSQVRWLTLFGHAQPFLTTNRRGPARLARRHRRRSSLVRYTLLAPPPRLTAAEAAVLLRIPRRALRAEPEWFAPGLGEITGQPPLELRAQRLHDQPPGCPVRQTAELD